MTIYKNIVLAAVITVIFRMGVIIRITHITVITHTAHITLTIHIIRTILMVHTVHLQMRTVYTIAFTPVLTTMYPFL